MRKRKTAGELSLKAASDSTKYKGLEVSNAILDDVPEQLLLCAQNHEKIFDEDEFCVVMVLAKDPLIQGVIRKKFYGYLYLPSPRPEQAVFLYNKKEKSIKLLWSLPAAKVMASLSEATYVSPRWKTSKYWADAFYSFKFWERIREQHGIKMLSELEYLQANREKLIQAGCKEIETLDPEPFDFSKVSVNKIVNTKTTGIQ